VQPADGVQGGRLPAAVACGARQAENLPGLAQRGLGLALPLQGQGELEVDPGLADLVAELTVEAEGLLQVGAPGLGGAGQKLAAAQALVGSCLPGQVAQALRGGQRGALGGGQVRPVPGPGQVIGQRPR
jgi:hypothetical protein